MEQSDTKCGTVRVVPLASIVVGEHEVRGAEADPELPELAASIARDGLINPMTVELRGEELHLIAGHRRYSACVLARVSQVPVLIRSGTGADIKRICFAENYHRKDLSPVQQARALVDVLADDTMTIEEVAATFRRTVEWVKDQIAILSWPEDVLACVHAKTISVSAAGNLAKISDSTYRQFLLQMAVSGGATARTTAGWLQGWESQFPAGEVVALPLGPGSSGPDPVLPMSLCVGCRGEFSPQGMVPIYLCPNCVSLLRGGALQRSDRQRLSPSERDYR